MNARTDAIFYLDPWTASIDVDPSGRILRLCDNAAAAYRTTPDQAQGQPLSSLVSEAWARERLALVPASTDEPILAVEIRGGKYCLLFVALLDDDTRRLLSRVSLPLPRHLRSPLLLRHHTWGELARLTRRQLEVLRYVAQGMDNIQIAQALFKTRRTAEWHLRSLYRVLHAEDRNTLSRIGFEAGLATMSDSVWAMLRDDWRASRAGDEPNGDTLAA